MFDRAYKLAERLIARVDKLIEVVEKLTKELEHDRK